MHTPVARTACALRILLLTSAFGREKALPALLECPVNRHQHEHLVDPQVTKTQSSGEGCKILFSESIRERAVFNGVRGSRRHRASGALDLVKLSSPLLHGVGPSARSACAAARSQRYRRRAQPVDSTPAQACSIRRSQPDSNAVAGPDGARSMSCASALPRKRRIRLVQGSTPWRVENGQRGAAQRLRSSLEPVSTM